VRDGEFAEVRSRLEVDAQRARPGAVPFLVGRIVGNAFIDSGIVDEHVDPAVELGQRRVPDVPRSCGIHEVAGDQVIAAFGRMTDNPVSVLLEERVGGRANATARAGDEDVHGFGQ
jgi:hypothetical protein